MNKYALVACFLFVGCIACSDGSSPSCPLPVTGNWIQGSYYDSGYTARRCAANTTACAVSFNDFFAGGLVCTKVAAVLPSSTVTVLAILSFFAAALSLCAPWAPSCLCGRASPAIMSFVGVVTHLLFFSLTVQVLASCECRGDVRVSHCPRLIALHFISATTSLDVSWSLESMEAALLAFTSITTKSNRLLFIARFSVPFVAEDVAAGIATGPIGIVVVCLAIIVMLLIAAHRSGRDVGNCTRCTPVRLSCSCCQAASGFGGVNFWYGPPWWWWYWLLLRDPVSRSRESVQASVPTTTVVIVQAPAHVRPAARMQSLHGVREIPEAPLPSAPPPDAPTHRSDDLCEDPSSPDAYPVAPSECYTSTSCPTSVGPDHADSHETQPMLDRGGINTDTIDLPSAGGRNSDAAQPYSNPNQLKQFAGIVCVQLVFACIAVGMIAGSWKRVDCITLASYQD